MDCATGERSERAACPQQVPSVNIDNMPDIVEGALCIFYRAWASGSSGTSLAEAARLTIIDPALGRRLAREFESRGLATRSEDPRLWRILPGGIAFVERLLPETDPDVVASRSVRNRILSALVDASGSASVQLSARALEELSGQSSAVIERTCKLLEEWHLVKRDEAGMLSITSTGRAIAKV